MSPEPECLPSERTDPEQSPAVATPLFADTCVTGGANIRSDSVRLHDPLEPAQGAPTSLPTSQAGRYPVFGELGRGGMGVVLQGRDTDLGRDLAIKILLEASQDDPDTLRRFLEEAQIGGQLQHPGVVPVYEMGRFDDRRPYFTMKLVKGQTLARMLAERQDPARDLPRFLTIFEQVCQTLAYAHSRGVIHRDLKPLNVMVGAFGEVQVMDWGLAKVLHPASAEQPATEPAAQGVGVIHTVRTDSAGAESQAGSVMGTPAYMAPEQATGDTASVDERADVFGLGAILCEILTGKPPYVRRAGAEVYQQAVGADLTDALERLDRCGADADLLLLAKACLTPRPQDRPRDAGEVARQVTAYRAGVQERLRQAELERAAAEVKAKEERKRRRLAVALAGAVLLLVAGGGGIAWWVQQDRAARAAEQARAEADTEREVTVALRDARSLQEQGKYAEALAAARKAEGRLAGGGTEALRHRVGALRADLAMLARLEEIRLEQAEVRRDNSDYDYARAAPLYARAFRDYGIDVLVTSAVEVGRRIAERSIRPALVAALDDWALCTADAAESKRLAQVAEAADQDPQGLPNQVRQAFARNDRELLRKLAARKGIEKLPPATLDKLGAALWNVGEMKAAVELLRQAQQEHSEDFWINHNLALDLLESRPPQRDEAIRFFTAAIASRSRSTGVQVHLNLSSALRERGRAAEAEAVCRKAIRLKPEYAIAHVQLGAALLQRGQLVAAEAAFRKAIALQPDLALAHNSLGLALKQQGKLPEAEAACRKAIALKPNIALFHSGLGEVLLLRGKSADAEAACRKAVGIKPDIIVPHGNRGLVLLRRRCPITGRDSQAVAQGSFGLVLLAQNKAVEAEAVYRKLIALEPTLPTGYGGLADALLGQGKFKETEALARRPRLSRRTRAVIWIDMAETLRRRGKLAEAEAANRKAVAIEPGFSLAHCALGEVLRQQGKAVEAEASCRKAISLSPSYAEAHATLGAALLQQAKFDAAEAAVRAAIGLKPSLAEPHLNLGSILRNKGAFGPALVELKRGQKLLPPTAPHHAQVQGEIQLCERLATVETKLAAVLAGKAQPADVTEQIMLAQICQQGKRLYGAAARFYADAFAAQPALAEQLPTQLRYNAACAAALAGCGQGRDAARLQEKDRVRWRKQAIAWLRADLALWDKQLRDNRSKAGLPAEQVLKHWQADTDLAGLRDATAVAKLPKDEREDCRKLWADVESLLQRFRK